MSKVSIPPGLISSKRSQESDSDVEARAALAARPALRAIQLDSLSALTAQRSERGRAAAAWPEGVGAEFCFDTGKGFEQAIR